MDEGVVAEVLRPLQRPFAGLSNAGLQTGKMSSAISQSAREPGPAAAAVADGDIDLLAAEIDQSGKRC